MRLEQTLVPRAEAGAGRTQGRWYPTHGSQRAQPSRLLAPALPLHGGEADETLNPPALPLLDSGSHINVGDHLPPLNRTPSDSPQTASGRRSGAAAELGCPYISSPLIHTKSFERRAKAARSADVAS